MGSGNFLGGGAQAFAVAFRHIGEAYTQLLVVGPDQRVVPGHVQMVGNQHQITRLIGGIHAACCVGDQKAADTQLLHYPDGEGYGLPLIPLVHMEASLH
ncbi:hypothetical protein D3C75_934820 [compost metagenome]